MVAPQLVDQRVPFLVPGSNQISRQWYLAFEALYRAVGSSGGSGSTDDLSPAALSVDTVAALIQSALQDLPVQPPVVSETVEQLQSEVSELRSLVAELSKVVDALQQSTVA